MEWGIKTREEVSPAIISARITSGFFHSVIHFVKGKITIDNNFRFPVHRVPEEGWKLHERQRKALSFSYNNRARKLVRPRLLQRATMDEQRCKQREQ